MHLYYCQVQVHIERTGKTSAGGHILLNVSLALIASIGAIPMQDYMPAQAFIYYIPKLHPPTGRTSPAWLLLYLEYPFPQVSFASIQDVLIQHLSRYQHCIEQTHQIYP